MSELALAVFASETGTHLVRAAARTGAGSRTCAASTRARTSSDSPRAGFRFLARSAPAFPSLLRAIHDPPPGLFLRGGADPELLSRPAVADRRCARLLGLRRVASRACSAASSRAPGCSSSRGLARGVDAEAHRGALEAGGATVAVLGCGIDRDYPAAHAQLARRIAETGLIVSEYAPGVEPAPWRFPARNRIVAGLCAATVVVEARERERRADHRRPRARGGEGGLRCPRRDRLGALGGHERRS